MTHAQTLLYVRLKHENKIGVLFGGESEGWKLAPIGVARPWQHAESISEVRLVQLLEELDRDEVELGRKDVQSEIENRAYSDVG